MENPTYGENPTYEETHQAKETQEYQEFGKYEPVSGSAKEKKKRRTAQTSAAMASAVAVTAIVVLAVIPAISIFAPVYGPVFGPVFDGVFDDGSDDLTVTGSFVTIDASDTTVRYTVELEDYDPELEYSVSLSNRFTERTQTFQSDTFSYKEENLRPDMEYTLTLTAEGEVLATGTVTTERQAEPHFLLVSYECTCPEDDLFHFEVDIENADGIWTDVTATLTDMMGNSSSVPITGSGQYAIHVISAGLNGDLAVLQITCMEDGEETILYNGQCDI